MRVTPTMQDHTYSFSGEERGVVEDTFQLNNQPNERAGLSNEQNSNMLLKPYLSFDSFDYDAKHTSYQQNLTAQQGQPTGNTQIANNGRHGFPGGKESAEEQSLKQQE